MISDDIKKAIEDSEIPVDVVLIDENTYYKMCSEMISALDIRNEKLKLFLISVLPERIFIEGIEIAINNGVEGYRII